MCKVAGVVVADVFRARMHSRVLCVLCERRSLWHFCEEEGEKSRIPHSPARVTLDGDYLRGRESAICTSKKWQFINLKNAFVVVVVGLTKISQAFRNRSRERVRFDFPGKVLRQKYSPGTTDGTGALTPYMGKSEAVVNNNSAAILVVVFGESKDRCLQSGEFVSPLLHRCCVTHI